MIHGQTHCDAFKLHVNVLLIPSREEDATLARTTSSMNGLNMMRRNMTVKEWDVSGWIAKESTESPL
jgi:hypothetical protein